MWQYSKLVQCPIKISILLHKVANKCKYLDAIVSTYMKNLLFTYFSWLNWQWVDNSGVLQWLAQALYAAEMAGEKVHIISHIPPGNGDCLGAWGRNYAKIIER